MTAGNDNSQSPRRRRLVQVTAAAAALLLFASARSLPADAPDTADPSVVTAEDSRPERPGPAKESGDRPPDRLPQPDH